MSDTNSEAPKSPPDYDDQLVHHVVVTRRSGTYYVIVDGSEVASATPAVPVSLDTTEVVMLAGVDFTGGGLPGQVGYAMNGKISYAAFYGGGLTELQAGAHFAAGS